MAAIGGCGGGLGDRPSARDAALAGAQDSGFTRPGQDLPPPLPDTTASAPEVGNGSVDAGIDLGLEPSDADGADLRSLGRADATPPPSADGGLAPETAVPATVSIVVLPDTQYYAAPPYTEVFAMQTNWIIAQKPLLNIQAVLHVGDVVDGCNSPDQWGVASAALHSLDGVVPYFLVPGNHDTDLNRKGLMNNYFGPATMPWVTGTMTVGQIENNYSLVNIGSQQWLVLGLEFGPRDAVMTWADSVLKAYPDRPAIIVTHAYLYPTGDRYDVGISGSDTTAPNYQYWIPQYYKYTLSEGIHD
ncbi:MAG TPA: metallophosphoesterase, partial [Polyangia bacterium]